MRNIIDIVEKYTSSNTHLRNYLKKSEFDPYANWPIVCQWLYNNDHLEDVSTLLGKPIENEYDLEEEEPDIFYKLPEDLQTECAEYVVDYLLRHDPASAPTYAHLSLRKNKLLPTNTWLIHFTDHAYEIMQHGFTKGVSQVDQLGLTTYMNNKEKEWGGYNFAFIADGRDAKWAASEGKYGKDAVVFQNSGVHTDHYGDQEEQIIFWGEDVSPKNIIVLTKNDGDWQVNSRRDLRNGNDVLYSGDFGSCIDWIEKNHQQYRKWLYG